MAKLEIALQKILGWEGGFANDPDDSGGPTMKGVTIATYKEYCRRKGKPVPTVEDLKRITNAEILDVADTLYWSKIQGDKINNQSIANLCFDSVWGSGTGYIKKIQQVLGVKADGIFGPMSLNALNSYTPQKELFTKLWNRRKQWFEGCNGAWKYLRGWMRRLNSFTFEETTLPFEEKDPSEISVNEPIIIEKNTIEESETTNKKSILEKLIELIMKVLKI